MQPTFLSSGDLIADRRADYAAALMESGDASAAADLLEQALDLAPGWAPGWFRLGEAREAAGHIEGAAAAYLRATELDPSDRLGAGLRLARLNGAPAPDAPPPAYVRDLFDAYADRFEQHLVEALGYRAPQAIAAVLARHGATGPFGTVVDLGCGTGLMGPLLRPITGKLIGIDLSERMLAVAAAKQLYDRLEAADVVAALEALPAGSVELVTAADVFCYLGDLAPVLTAAAHALAPRGRLAFTVETDPAVGTGFTLRDSLRYAHAPASLMALAGTLGFRVEAMETLDLRQDRGAPVTGLAALFTRS
ncbi:methyltransferase domain-containing protein [Methyloraptor flagellatus]|uniref:Methyltransferase domain-containing protein n=1 Tax=Methyloraptor flagellatus TaxID=3162530 RepID=A0AAU7X599_9HYPH